MLACNMDIQLYWCNREDFWKQFHDKKIGMRNILSSLFKPIRALNKLCLAIGTLYDRVVEPIPCSLNATAFNLRWWIRRVPCLSKFNKPPDKLFDNQSQVSVWYYGNCMPLVSSLMKSLTFLLCARWFMDCCWIIRGAYIINQQWDQDMDK